jgi:HTH-type transcriptional regulator/antitoxin HigA
MGTAFADPVEMIRLGAPHVIHNDAELTEYTQALFHLTGKQDPTPDEEEAIELLTLLVEKYEEAQYPIAPADPITTLRFLIESHGFRQKDLAEDFGGEGNVSQVLAGKRNLNRDHIARLSKRFNVSPAVFFA